ncbi:hypothetical protein K438DRAFT_1998691 [Mycena galopus ATCC 62051]|nr:hypothetical protein K438DRAFT_1998691 [Mycena galopus ATCC 62051]
MLPSPSRSLVCTLAFPRLHPRVPSSMPSPSLTHASALTMPPATITPMEALVLCFTANLQEEREYGVATASTPAVPVVVAITEVTINVQPVTAAQRSELEGWNPAPVDIVVLESEAGHWGWMWWLATGRLRWTQVCDKAHSDLSLPAPDRRDDDEDELTSTESVDLSAPGPRLCSDLNCDLPSLSSPSMTSFIIANYEVEK